MSCFQQPPILSYSPRSEEGMALGLNVMGGMRASYEFSLPRVFGSSREADVRSSWQPGHDNRSWKVQSTPSTLVANKAKLTVQRVYQRRAMGARASSSNWMKGSR